MMWDYDIISHIHMQTAGRGHTYFTYFSNIQRA